jgi:hypothetical protein
MLTFDLLCLSCRRRLQRVDRTASPVAGPQRPRDASLAFAITVLKHLVPPPDLYSQSRFPPE